MESNKPDKEAILDFFDTASKSFITQETTYVNREAALKAMDKFSASQNSELKKEVERLNNLIEQLMNGEKIKVIRNDVGNYTIIHNPNNL